MTKFKAMQKFYQFRIQILDHDFISTNKIENWLACTCVSESFDVFV